MDKLKSVFSHGSKKDDTVKYGDAETRTNDSVGSSKPFEAETAPLHPTADAHKQDHSILRQVLNPDGHKHDDQRFGTTATTEAPNHPPHHLHTHSHTQDHTIVDQILNPHHEKYDPDRFNATAETRGDGRRESVRPEVGPEALVDPEAKLHTENPKKEHSILRQILNPHGENYDAVAYGQNAHVVSNTQYEKEQERPANQKDHSIARQILNPNGDKYDPAIYGTPSESNAGATAASAVSAQYAEPSPQTHPTSSSAVAGVSSTPSRPGEPTLSDRAVQTTTTTVPPSDSHLGRDAAIASGVGVAGAGAYATSHHGDGTKGGALYNPRAPEQLGPASVIANDSGSSPLTSGYSIASQPTGEPHVGRDAATASGVGLAGAGAYAATQHDEPHDNTLASNKIADRPHPLGHSAHGGHINPISAPELPESQPGAIDSHLGRDAAIASGAGLAGAGAYTATQHTKPYDDAAESGKITDRPHPLNHRADGGHINPINAPELPESQPGSEAHLRHAAFPTGAGVASTGTYSSDPDSALGTGLPNTGSATSRTQQTGAGTQQANTGSQQLGGVTNPEIPSTTAPFQNSQEVISKDAVLAGGVGAGGAGIAAGAASTQLSQAHTDAQPPTSTERSAPLGDASAQQTTDPRATFATNRLDSAVPHVPGEFPSEDGEDIHRINPPPLYANEQTNTSATTAPAPVSNESVTVAGVTGAGGGPGSYGLSGTSTSAVPLRSGVANQDAPIQTTTNSIAHAPAEAQGTKLAEHHYGRDVALVGGVGALGAGGYVASKPHNDTAPASTSTSTAPNGGTSAVAASSQAQPQSRPIPVTDDDQHYGKDAAIAGGTGAAGLAAYEASKKHAEAGPASKTIGPHDSNAANVADPRVKPVPEQMKESTTVGPHQSDFANKADPRVESDPAKLAAQKAAKNSNQDSGEVASRDAEIAAGTAGATAYGAEQAHDDREPKKLQKSQDKEAKKEEKAHQKEVEKQEKAQQKEIAKQEKTHQKEVEKQEKAEQKELDKEDKADYDSRKSGENKRGLLDKILHPTKKSEEDSRVVHDEDGHNKLHKKHVPKAYEQMPSGAEAQGSGAVQE